MPFSFNILALSFLSLLTTTAITSSSSTTIGVSYRPPTSSISNFPSAEHVASTLVSLRIPSVHILYPTPAAIRAFAYSNISLLLTVPNSLISSFAANASSASEWLFYHVLPFHPRAHISLISVGSDVVSSSSILDPSSDPSTVLIPAMRNLHFSLLDMGINTISVSTTFSFINTISTTFPPSSAEFQDPINHLVVKPVLQFLADTNSSFLIDIFPYTVYKFHSEIPIGFALFQEDPFNFRDDAITASRYRNLFDVMVDGVVTALAISGHENMRVIVTQTGWPCSSATGDYPEATPAYAQMYLKGLISHLKSGLGTPLKKDGVAEVYIYELFDDDDYEEENNNNNPVEMMNNTSGSDKTGEQHHWGILYPNMTMKYNLEFSGSEKASGIDGGWGVELVLIGIILQVVFWLL